MFSDACRHNNLIGTLERGIVAVKRTLAIALAFLFVISFLAGCSGGGGGSDSGGGIITKDDLIIMLGNSITRRTDWSAKMPDNNMMNMGVDGAMTSDMVGRLSRALSYNPKLLCVMGGINDLIAHRSVASIYANLENIAIRARDAGVLVMLQSTLMTGALYPNSGIINPQIRDELNPMLSALASREENIQYLELNSALGNGRELLDEYLNSDHLHPNDAGYNVWAERLKSNLP
jgi:lysophospholipase L1-like esterase